MLLDGRRHPATWSSCTKTSQLLERNWQKETNPPPPLFGPRVDSANTVDVSPLCRRWNPVNWIFAHQFSTPLECTFSFMAVVAPPPLSQKLDYWGPGNSSTYHPQSSTPMTDIMSYQYPPPPPPNGAEMGIPPPGYIPDYSTIPPPPSSIDMRPVPDSDPHSKERRDSLSKQMKLKRSLSTPSVRAQQSPAPPPPMPTPDHGAMSLSAEKRRNKLGYHRTSVACGKSDAQMLLTLVAE